MMGSAAELYQEIILDHNKRPRNFEKLDGANKTAEGHNPLCGDRFSVYLRVKDDLIEAASFLGNGCAISKASASLMTTFVKGKTIAEARQIFEKFRRLVSGDKGDDLTEEALGKLAVFSGVSEFPARVKCASLAWHTLAAAMEPAPKPVSTE